MDVQAQSSPIPMPSLLHQFGTLLLLAIPIASIAWTVTHEEVFREPREWCAERSRDCRKLVQRKFFYLFTCEYCFSHYVTIFFLILTRFKLLYPDWRGYLISGFALVWVANAYMSAFGRLRLDIKHEHVDIAETELRVNQEKENQEKETEKENQESNPSREPRPQESRPDWTAGERLKR
jgi:hypothetical protein